MNRAKRSSCYRVQQPVVTPAKSGQQPKLMDRFRDAIRVRHYSRRTEEVYGYWIKRFIFHGGKPRHPQTLCAVDVTGFLTHIAVKERVSASTQNQAFSAILFLYKQVLGVELGNIDAVRAKRSRRIPVVLTRDEVKAVLALLRGVYWLVASLLYGAGLRIECECLKLRVKDVDFDRRLITVRQGKGDKDRIVPLPAVIVDRLKRHLEQGEEAA